MAQALMVQRRIVDGPLVAGIFVLRIFFGLVYLTNGLAKFVPGIAHTPYGFLIDFEGARGIITFDAHHNKVDSYRSLADQVLLPNWNVFGNLQGALEVLAGVLLIVGLAAAWAALLAALLSLHIQFAALYNGEWLYTYAVEWIPLLCLAALRPGRWLGLDGAIVACRRASRETAR